MNKTDIIKAIKLISKAEAAKLHERFLKKEFPKILKEAIDKRISTLNESNSISNKYDEEIDPFDLADKVLEDDRNHTESDSVNENKKVFSKNPILNEVLSQTKPFTPDQRSSTGNMGGNGKSVLDMKSMMEEDNDKTLNFNSSMVGPGANALGDMAEHQLGVTNRKTTRPEKGGLGVKTGLKGLDRILNRDNSELVKRFKK